VSFPRQSDHCYKACPRKTLATVICPSLISLTTGMPLGREDSTYFGHAH